MFSPPKTASYVCGVINSYTKSINHNSFYLFVVFTIPQLFFEWHFFKQWMVFYYQFTQIIITKNTTHSNHKIYWWHGYTGIGSLCSSVLPRSIVLQIGCLNYQNILWYIGVASNVLFNLRNELWKCLWLQPYSII